MTARVGLGFLITALVALAAWLVVGAVSASAEPRAATDAGGGLGASAIAPLVPGNGTGGSDGTGSGAHSAAPDTAPSSGGGADAAAAPGGSGGPADAGAASSASGPGAPAGTPSATAALDAVDTAWAAGVAQATGIPQRAVVGYAGAALALRNEQPGCGLGWNTIAALGWIESGHGTHASSSIGAIDGVTTPRILGPALDGGEFDAIDDTDAGTLDGDTGRDRAVGPLQFIPSTWQSWGADGSGDGMADPQQIDDASLAAARYLCHYGALDDAATWRTAVFAYNHVESYVDSVAATANQYAAQAASVPISAGTLP